MWSFPRLRSDTSIVAGGSAWEHNRSLSGVLGEAVIQGNDPAQDAIRLARFPLFAMGHFAVVHSLEC